MRPIVSFHFLFPSVYGRATRIDTDLRAKKSAIPKELPIKKSSTIILVTSVNIIKFKLHIIPIICIFFHLPPLASAGNLRVARNTFCETKKYIMKRNAICKKWNVPKALPCNAFRSHVNPALTVTFLKTARAATSKDSKSGVLSKGPWVRIPPSLPVNSSLAGFSAGLFQWEESRRNGILVPFLPKRENGTPRAEERRLAKNLASRKSARPLSGYVIAGRFFY